MPRRALRGTMYAHRVCNCPVPKPRGSPAVRGFDFLCPFTQNGGKDPTWIAVTSGVGVTKSKQGSQRGDPREPNRLRRKAQSPKFNVRTFGEEMALLWCDSAARALRPPVLLTPMVPARSWLRQEPEFRCGSLQQAAPPTPPGTAASSHFQVLLSQECIPR